MYGKMQESGLTEILPLICTSATGASILYFSHFEFLRVPLREWLLPDGCKRSKGMFWDLDGPYLSTVAPEVDKV